MVFERIPGQPVDASILSEQLEFPSGKIAKNRFLKSAMTEKMATWTEFPNTRGQPTERLINLYSAWGVGGFGLVVTGNLMVHPTMLEAAGNAVITRENTSPQLVELYRRWAEAIKEQGSLAIAQLAIAGRQTPFALDRNPYSASDVQLVAPMSKFGQPIPLTVEQIRTEVVDRFVYAAKLLKETGWDGVQLGAAHGFLLSQFISPTTNKRTDKYGGCIENRMRIVIEVHDAIREKIPTTSGFIVGVKTNSVEFQNDGLDTADAVRSAELLDKAGFDFIELSGGSMEDWGYKHREKESTRRREAYFLEFADKIRPVVSSAVLFVTGGFRTTKGMVDAITSGVTNGIGIARPAASEPDLPKKILNGGVHAASDNKFPADNHIVQLMIAMTQMWYIGNRPMHDKSDPCEDIPDFSVPEEAANFQQVALPAFFANFMSKLHADEPFVDIPEYVPLASA